MPKSDSQQPKQNRTFDLPVDKLLASFILHLRAARRSDATILKYEGNLRRFLAATPHPFVVTRPDVEAWIASLGNRAPSTLFNYYMDVRLFFDWLVREGEIGESPFGPKQERLIRPPAIPETRKDVVTPQDMAKVIDDLKAPQKRTEARYVAEGRWRDAAVIAVLYETGMRTSELCELQADDVDIRTGLILLRTTKNKTMRRVRLGPEALALLDRYWRRPRKEPEFAFNGNQGRWSRTGMYQLITRRFRQAGITGTISPHDLRHTSASHIVGEMSDSSMMKLYGWRTPAMLQRYTNQLAEEAALRAHETASPMRRLPKR